jgi:hypothetical protein
MRSSILLILSPAFAIMLLIAALPRMPFRWLTLVSVILGIRFVGGVLAGQFGLPMLLMYALGAVAVILAAGLRSRHHGCSVGQST